MTDLDLLKWVAEELLGWEPAKYPTSKHLWHDESGRGYFGGDLQSWHGIGLVVEAMEKRGFHWEKSPYGFRFYLPTQPDHLSFPWVYSHKIHTSVFAAAKRTMHSRGIGGIRQGVSHDCSVEQPCDL